MRVLLIRPRVGDRELLSDDSALWVAGRGIFNKFSRMKVGNGSDIAPMSLMVLAAMTPPEHEVTIVDEEVQEIDFESDADVVGITLLTTTAPRGYEIADRFRERGVNVVFGGIHATVLPAEVADHADAVVIGEAEGVWPRVLDDMKSGRPRKFYRGRTFCDMRGMAIPRQDLVTRDRYLTTNVVQTTRGCPNKCSFCSIHAIAGRRYRSRPVADVIAELETLPDPLTAIVDDNIVGDPEYAKQLFRAMIPLRLKWWGQGTLAITADDELLRLASASGCKILVVGFESLSADNIRDIGKARTNDVRGYEEAIAKLHAHGICVQGSFILGLDNDDLDVFPRTVEFIQKNHIDVPLAGVLTPYPGTRLFDKLDRDGRLLHKKWRHYGEAVGKVVFRPKLMTPEQLQQGHNFVGRQIHSIRGTARRLLGVRQNYVPSLAYNLAQRRYFVGLGDTLRHDNRVPPEALGVRHQPGN